MRQAAGGGIQPAQAPPSARAARIRSRRTSIISTPHSRRPAAVRRQTRSRGFLRCRRRSRRARRRHSRVEAARARPAGVCAAGEGGGQRSVRRLGSGSDGRSLATGAPSMRRWRLRDAPRHRVRRPIDAAPMPQAAPPPPAQAAAAAPTAACAASPPPRRSARPRHRRRRRPRPRRCRASLVDAFAALLAAEQKMGLAPSAATSAASASAPASGASPAPVITEEHAGGGRGPRARPAHRSVAAHDPRRRRTRWSRGRD